ncbi:MAG TPA: hypothetical protein VLC07_01450 [Solirubrobacterales bacterium]|nr:hypothetical protein [Solirubrobacterales bacterium]
MNFEAGALAKAVESSRVVPIAIDLSPAEIPNPLGQFQAITLDKDDVSDLVRSLNEACPASIAGENLVRTFEKWWPDLDTDLKSIKEREYGSEEASASPARSDREMLEEVLDSVRGLSRRQDDSARRLRHNRDDLSLAIDAAAQNTGAKLGSIVRIGDHWRISLMGPTPLEFLDELRALEKAHGDGVSFTVEPSPR